MIRFGAPVNHLVSRIAIVCLVVAMHGSALYLGSGAGIQNYSNGIGQPKHFSLGGSSEFILDARSILTVVRERNLQRIFVLAGKVDFRLVHDPSLTTMVYANGLLVTDIGTHFSVEIQDNGQANVVVAEGVVAADSLPAGGVGSPCRDASQLPNPALSASTPVRDHEWARTQQIGSNIGLQKATLTDAQLARRMAWTHGELIFDGEPLAEVVNEVSRYFPAKITFDDSIKDLHINGVYTTARFDTFVHTLTYTHHLEAHRDGQNEIRLSRSPAAPSQSGRGPLPQH